MERNRRDTANAHAKHAADGIRKLLANLTTDELRECADAQVCGYTAGIIEHEIDWREETA